MVASAESWSRINGGERSAASPAHAVRDVPSLVKYWLLVETKQLLKVALY
jgi:hypothetical protein